MWPLVGKTLAAMLVPSREVVYLQMQVPAYVCLVFAAYAFVRLVINFRRYWHSSDRNWQAQYLVMAPYLTALVGSTIIASLFFASLLMTTRIVTGDSEYGFGSFAAVLWAMNSTMYWIAATVISSRLNATISRTLPIA